MSLTACSSVFATVSVSSACEGEAQAQTAETGSAPETQTIDATNEEVCVSACEAVCEWQAAVCETKASRQTRTETEMCVSASARVSVCAIVCEWANQAIATRVCELAGSAADAAGVCEC